MKGQMPRKGMTPREALAEQEKVYEERKQDREDRRQAEARYWRGVWGEDEIELLRDKVAELETEVMRLRALCGQLEGRG